MVQLINSTVDIPLVYLRLLRQCFLQVLTPTDVQMPKNVWQILETTKLAFFTDFKARLYSSVAQVTVRFWSLYLYSRAWHMHNKKGAILVVFLFRNQRWHYCTLDSTSIKLLDSRDLPYATNYVPSIQLFYQNTARSVPLF